MSMLSPLASVYSSRAISASASFSSVRRVFVSMGRSFFVGGWGESRHFTGLDRPTFSAHTAPTTGLTAQRYQQVSSLLAGLKQCGLGVGFFFHAPSVFDSAHSCTHKTNHEDSSSMSTWPDGTKRSTGNAFTVRPASLFAGDKAEIAKATLHRKQSFYGQATGAVGHGHEVMPTLSAKAQKLLKATPYSQPLAPSKSLAYRAKVDS